MVYVDELRMNAAAFSDLVKATSGTSPTAIISFLMGLEPITPPVRHGIEQFLIKNESIGNLLDALALSVHLLPANSDPMYSINAIKHNLLMFLCQFHSRCTKPSYADISILYKYVDWVGEVIMTQVNRVDNNDIVKSSTGNTNVAEIW